MLFLLLCLEGIIAASAIISVAPLADILLDQTLNKPSSITTVIIKHFDDWGLKSGFVLFEENSSQLMRAN